MEWLLALILEIAPVYNVPPYLVYAIAIVENPQMDVNAVNRNRNGTTDIGLMQLNSSWYRGDPQDVRDHISQACGFLEHLHEYYDLNWWQTAIGYNCGVARILQGDIPDISIEYANKVFAEWDKHDAGFRRFIDY